MDLTNLDGAMLTSVKLYGDPDLPSIDGAVMLFESESLSMWVDPDFDTVELAKGAILPSYACQVEKPPVRILHKFVGGVLIFSWQMRNQKGYLDAVQFMFNGRQYGRVVLQFMAIASRLVILTLSECDGDRVSFI